MIHATSPESQSHKEQKPFKLSGIVSAMVSPIDEKGNLNVECVASLVEFLLERGVSGFFICGSNGEGFRLRVEERKALAQEVVQVVNSRVPVVVHVGSMNFREVMELSGHAAEINADAVSSVVPFYYSYTMDEIFEYYKSISDVSMLPTIIYYLSSVNASMDMIKFSERIENSNKICGIKYTNEDLYQIDLFRTTAKKDIQLYGGADHLPLPMLMAGVDALIGSNFSAIPEPWVKLYNAFRGRAKITFTYSDL